MKIAKAGLPFVGGALLGAAVLGLAWGALAAAPLLLLAAYFCWFFRDPERCPPAEERAVLAPGDGRVVALAERPDGRAGISIFLGLFDVHVNRSPVDGVVREVEHVAGRFVAAWRPDAGEINEQNRIRLETDAGVVDLRQVVGLAARRVACWARPGQRVRAGERIGIMKFGSRLDLVLPPGSEVLARPGQRVRAGETLIGRLPRPAPGSAS